MSNLFMDYGLATPHDQLHVPTPAYAPMGNAYIHHFQCQPPNKSLHQKKKNSAQLILLMEEIP